MASGAGRRDNISYILSFCTLAEFFEPSSSVYTLPLTSPTSNSQVQLSVVSGYQLLRTMLVRWWLCLSTLAAHVCCGICSLSEPICMFITLSADRPGFNRSTQNTSGRSLTGTSLWRRICSLGSSVLDVPRAKFSRRC